MNKQTIFVSATPADYELEKSDGVVVEQIIRPTGLLDPIIEVRPSENQMDNLLEEIRIRVERRERVLVTTLTKRMAEELAKYLTKFTIKCRYIHSDVNTLERIEIIYGLREGEFDVLIGVNLLREGLDLPEVSLVVILDADKEGFLRSQRALTQTAGRAARNLNGLVVMYADKTTKSMKRTIEETNRRRKKQHDYNEKYNIKPKPIIKKLNTEISDSLNPYSVTKDVDTVTNKMDSSQIKKMIKYSQSEMEKAAKNLNFIEAARLRDDIINLKERLKVILK